MFKKLLSNLPFNPSLINQVSFYAKRIHQEERIRRSGLVLVILAFFVQLIAMLAPPQPTLASSPNDIIPGGFSSKASAVDLCVKNSHNFQDILRAFDIDCTRLNSANVQTIRSTDYGRKLLSIGRLPYGKDGERPVTIGGVKYYQRYLWSWDSGPYSSYQALVGTRSNGAPFMVLFDCANVTVVETTSAAPAPAAPKQANVQIVKKTTLADTPQAGQVVRPGDVLGYRIYFQNSGNAPATNVFVEDSTPKDTSFVTGSQGSGKADRYSYLDTVYPGHGQEPHVYWAYNSMPAGATGYYVDFKVKVNTGTKDGAQICNTAYIRSNENAQTPSPEKVCHTVEAKAPAPVKTVTNVAPPPIATKPCAASQTSTDTTSCLELHKTARNDTKQVANANGTTAAAGDTITYTLTTKNNGTVSASNYVIEENLADVLEYADLIGDFSGASLGSDHILRWPAVTIGAGQTVTRTVSIKIKNPLPQTPTPPSNPGSFDLMMTNVYGDAVNIKLPGSVAVIVARANTTLPNTGPGTTVTIAVMITMIAGYFFARSRLMGKELDLVREEYASSGGIS